MLRIEEKVDDKIEVWNFPNLKMITFKDLCLHYLINFPLSSDYRNNKKVEVTLYNKDKLVLTFSLTKH